VKVLCASVALAALLGVACSGSAVGPETEPVRTPRPRADHGEAERARRDALAAERIAMVPGGTFGPYVGARPEGLIAAWAAEVSGKRRWMTVAVGDDGKALADPKTVADAPPEVDLVAVRPLSSGEASGFVLLASSRAFSGERVDLLALGLRGELAGGPTPLASAVSDVVWVDAVPTPSGAIAMWAVRREDRADLFGVQIGSSGNVKEEPSLLVEGVRAWQVTKAPGGAAIATLTAGKTRSESGPIRLTFVDGEGHVDKKSLVVATGTTAEPDLDLAHIGDHFVLAWSDRRDLEPRLYGAVVDANGNLSKAPAPLGVPFGSQSVLRVVPPESDGGPAFLAWENLVERRAASRAVRLATLSENGVLGDASALLQMSSEDAMPELSATAKGIAALTLAPACKRREPCPSDRAVPTFVQFDGALDVVASEPVRIDAQGGEPVDLAWGLTCRRLECLALGAAPASPAAPVYAVKLGGISDVWEPPARRVNDAPAPRATRMETVGVSDTVAELAAARVGASSLVAWVSYFDPSIAFAKSKTVGPDGKMEPPRAVVRVRALPDAGATTEPTVVSYRAHSPGGVALAAGDPAKSEALLAWVGIDNKLTQVFLTLVGADGKKISQKMLTHGKDGVSDVALAFVGDGWVVGWVDERGTSSEIHVAKVDRSLKAVVPERRVGATVSTATGPQLLARGEHVFLVWSDARGPSAGVADVFAARLSVKDLSAVGPEHGIVSTPTHSRSPAVAAFGEGAVVAWVEDSPQGGEHAPSTLMIARLDSGAELVAGSAIDLSLSGSPEGVGLACGKAGCQVAVTAAAGESGGLEGLEWRPDGEVHPTRLLNLESRPRDAFGPFVLGSEVFYADESRPSDARVRRLGVTWE
jgi:hypothetical protein